MTTPPHPDLRERLTAAIVAADVDAPFDNFDLKRIRDAALAVFDEQLREARAAVCEECAKVAKGQPFYPDTHTGMRQQWIKDQIAAAILALRDPGS